MISKRPLLLVPLLVGCYTYTPIEPAAVAPGAEVRARISGAASDRVAPLIGALDVRVLTGDVVENRGGALVLEVPNGAMLNTGETIVALRQRVPLAVGDVVQLESRTLNRGRTAFMAAAIAAGAGLVAYAAIKAGGGKAEVPVEEPPPPPTIRIPAWRFHF